MKKLIPAIAILAVLFSCNNAADKGKFTVEGELKNTLDQQVYLEELFFSQRAPEVLDSGSLKNGKFKMSATGQEEGLYRIRVQSLPNNYLFINDKNNISFTADVTNPYITGPLFNSPANISLKALMVYSDSLQQLISAKYKAMIALSKNNVKETDSVYRQFTADFNNLKGSLTKYCLQYADTAKSPVVALFAATIAPVEMEKFILPLTNLAARFPKHNGIGGALAFIKEQLAQQKGLANTTTAKAAIGSMAPDISMNDLNDKPFSLNQLRGKYVLVDFWASWCGPCRGENPNVVAAYDQFKNKNFTILGVSLDDDKVAWKKAITDDKLNWQQVSDLKKWRSAAVDSYGLDGIPFNVLVDPEGKIIANNLRGEQLQSKLAEVLK